MKINCTKFFAPRLVFLLMAASMFSHAYAASEGDACYEDLRVIPDYLVRNDAGAKANIEARGEAEIRREFEAAQVSAKQATSEKECDAVIEKYLRAYRKSHLHIAPFPLPSVNGSDAKKYLPSFRVVSRNTTILRIPSFQIPGSFTKKLIDENIRTLSRRRNLIIDVRGNSGGNDEAWGPLLPLIEKNVWRSRGVDFLATPQNIAAGKKTCEMRGAWAAACLAAVKPLLEKMEAAEPGSFVQVDGPSNDDFIKAGKTMKMPSHVAVLTDRYCASSCEEFLLAAKQSFKTKIFGEPTQGELDYSNSILYLLPSNRRLLQYATSRSHRAPYFPVDNVGIQPDYLLINKEGGETPDSAVEYVEKILNSIR